MAHESSDPDRIRRAARQHAQTGRLLGVDFLPIAQASAKSAKGDGADGARKAPPSSSQTPPARPEADVEPKPRVKHPVSEPPSQPPPSQVPARRAGVRTGGGAVDKAIALAELRARYERESEVAKAITGWNNIVFSDGSPDAPLMFIGEAPGADEDACGIPFVGRSGQKLNEMITAMKFDRAASGQRGVYITSVLKVRPPNNRTPTREEAMADGVFLEEQIRIVSPRVIVTLGKPSSNYLLRSNESMGSLRGVWHEFEGIPVMPTYHPAFLLRAYTPENRRRVWDDLQLALGRLRELGAIDF